MDMTFWQQFCASPMGGHGDPGSASPDLSDLDSSPGWSPLSSLEDQENYSNLPLMPSSYQGQDYSGAISPNSSTTSSYGSQYNPLSLQHQYNTNTNLIQNTTTPNSIQHRHTSSGSDENRPTSGSGSTSTRSRNPVKRVQQRTAANHRERKRMRTINEAFEGLREKVPLASGDRKLSKVDTLRLAIRYIHHLSDMVTTCGKLEGGPGGQPEQDAAKVIIRCHGAEFQDYCGDANGNFPLYGHSLSWEDNKQSKVGANGRLVAKLWVPEQPDPTTLQDSFDCESLPL